MIARIWGKCNGADIVFSHDIGERWKIAVPAALDKTYVVEVWAEDMAGNVGYLMTVVVYYDSITMDMRFRVIDVAPKFFGVDMNLVFKEIPIFKWRV